MSFFMSFFGFVCVFCVFCLCFLCFFFCVFFYIFFFCARVRAQLTEADQELYANFPLVVSERWQQEIAETVFDAVNQETDKLEQKRRPKARIDDHDDNCKATLGCLAVLQ